MARDYAGFEQGRKRDEQGRPLKLQTPPPSEKYRENYPRIFGKKRRKERHDDEHDLDG